MKLSGGHVRAILLVGATALAGCEQIAPTPAPPPPPSQPPQPRPDVREQSQASLKAQAYYQRVQNTLLTQGLLRTDGGGPDTPFTAESLTRDFLRIALFQEYAETSTRLIARENSSFLHRWTTPVRYEITYGASVPMDQRSKDSRTIKQYGARLSRLTQLGFSENSTNTNMHIFVVNEDERKALGPTLRSIVPGISQATVNAAINMNRDTYCLAFAASPGNSGSIAKAIIIIRGEHPDLMRRSCVHEEIAQALGLPNDSPDARPSIFNDDSEFALLTTHDELLLRILYDPRLRPGMKQAEARPIVETIAAELLGGSV